jgi:hypothetical protein
VLQPALPFPFRSAPSLDKIHCPFLLYELHANNYKPEDVIYVVAKEFIGLAFTLETVYHAHRRVYHSLSQILS